MVQCPDCQDLLCDEMDVRLNEVVEAHYREQHPTRVIDLREEARQRV